MKSGSKLITEERQRQIDEEGWTAEHDDELGAGALAVFGACYALDVAAQISDYSISLKARYAKAAGELLPFDREYWKPTLDRVRQLVKAGALIAAEIDRLQRK